MPGLRSLYATAMAAMLVFRNDPVFEEHIRRQFEVKDLRMSQYKVESPSSGGGEVVF